MAEDENERLEGENKTSEWGFNGMRIGFVHIVCLGLIARANAIRLAIMIVQCGRVGQLYPVFAHLISTDSNERS